MHNGFYQPPTRPRPQVERMEKCRMSGIKIIDAGDKYLVRTDSLSNLSSNIAEVQKESPSLEARIMLECITKWGMVTGTPDGEDSSGRSVLTCMPTEELVSRAADIAERAVHTIRSKGWMKKQPAPEDIYGDPDDTI